jgi:hypothetical protein
VVIAQGLAVIAQGLGVIAQGLGVILIIVTSPLMKEKRRLILKI